MARRLEDHLDVAALHARTCISEREIWNAIKRGDIDPVVEFTGKNGQVTRTLIPESSAAKWLAERRVYRKQPEIVTA